MENMVCEVCGEGTAKQFYVANDAEYKGVKRILALQMHECDVCGSQYANADDMRANKRGRIAFEKEVDKLLTGTQVKAIREALRLTQSQAAVLFGGGPVAFSKYENDEIVQSIAMDRILRLVAEVPGALETLSRISSGDDVVRVLAVPEARNVATEERPPFASLVQPRPGAHVLGYGKVFRGRIAFHAGRSVLTALPDPEQIESSTTVSGQERTPRRVPYVVDHQKANVLKVNAFRITMHGAAIEDFHRHEELLGDKTASWPSRGPIDLAAWEFFPVETPQGTH